MSAVLRLFQSPSSRPGIGTWQATGTTPARELRAPRALAKFGLTIFARFFRCFLASFQDEVCDAVGARQGTSGILGLSNNLAKSKATEFDPGLLLKRTSGKCCSTLQENVSVSFIKRHDAFSISKFVAVRVSGGIGSSLGRVFFSVCLWGAHASALRTGLSSYHKCKRC